MGEGAGRSGGFNDLGPRLASAFVMAALALAAFWAGGVYSAVLVGVTAALMLFECRAITLGVAEARRAMLYLIAMAGAAVSAQMGGAAAGLIVLIAFAIAGALADRFRAAWAWSFLFALYFGLAAVMVVALRGDGPHGYLSVLWIVLVVVATDTGAYVSGRMIGGAKLWPSVSPKKTWAGLLGGAGLAGLTSAVFSGLALGYLELALIPLAIFVACVAQGGDLAESAFKRKFGVKDSSRMIPGHGGVFDRLDGMVAAVIAAGLITLARGGAPIYLW